MKAVPREACVVAIREDVCSICACYSPSPSCRSRCIHETQGDCVVFARLEDLIGIVARFAYSDLASYENVFQMYACTRCAMADSEGVCTLRDRTKPVPEWCIADAYLPQIVGAIERVQQVEVG